MSNTAIRTASLAALATILATPNSSPMPGATMTYSAFEALNPCSGGRASFVSEMRSLKVEVKSTTVLSLADALVAGRNNLGWLGEHGARIGVNANNAGLTKLRKGISAVLLAAFAHNRENVSSYTRELMDKLASYGTAHGISSEDFTNAGIRQYGNTPTGEDRWGKMVRSVEASNNSTWFETACYLLHQYFGVTDTTEQLIKLHQIGQWVLGVLTPNEITLAAGATVIFGGVKYTVKAGPNGAPVLEKVVIPKPKQGEKYKHGSDTYIVIVGAQEVVNIATGVRKTLTSEGAPEGMVLASTFVKVQ